MKKGLILVLVFTILFSIFSFIVSAQSKFGYNYLDNYEVNYSLVPTVNNTEFFQGYTPLTLRSYFESYYNTQYAPLNYGDDWNKSYADTLYSSITEPLSLHLNQDNWFNDSNGWINWDGNSNEFNDSKLSTIFYNASEISTIVGTTAGSISDIQAYDGISYNITEVASNPGLDFRINFTLVESFNSLIIRYMSDNSENHKMQIQLYNYITSSWEDYGYLGTVGTFETKTLGVFDSENHLSGGIVQLRFVSSSLGNPSHEHYFDWVAISKGYGTPSGQEIDPYWNSEKENYVKFNDSTSNINLTGYNITASYFKGDGSLLTGISGGDGTGGWTNTSTNTSTNLNVSINGSVEIQGDFLQGSVADPKQFKLITTEGDLNKGFLVVDTIDETPLAGYLIDGYEIESVSVDSSGNPVAFDGDMFMQYYSTGDLYLCNGGGRVFTYGLTNSGTIASTSHILSADKLSAGRLLAPLNSKFGVYGNVAIGTGYFNTAAPNNGMIIQNWTGIGTTTPMAPLEIALNDSNNNLSIITTGGILADAYYEHSEVYDEQYLLPNGEINYSSHPCYLGEIQVNDYDKPIYENISIEVICNETYIGRGNKTITNIYPCNTTEDVLIGYETKMQPILKTSCRTALAEQVIRPSITEDNKTMMNPEIIIADEYITNTTRDTQTMNKINDLRDILRNLTYPQVASNVLNEDGRLSDYIVNFFNLQSSSGIGSYNLEKTIHYDFAMTILLAWQNEQQQIQIDQLQTDLQDRDNCVLNANSLAEIKLCYQSLQ